MIVVNNVDFEHEISRPLAADHTESLPTGLFWWRYRKVFFETEWYNIDAILHFETVSQS